jgi:hypothetical protein
VPNGITAAQITGGANNSSSITITATQNAINATLAAVNGLQYVGNADFNGSDTLTIATDDNNHTGTGGPLTTTNTLGITVNNVNDAPLVVNGTSVSLVAIDEDTASPAGATVGGLLAGHFDDSADNQTASGGSAANTFAGIAVTANAATAGQGKWLSTRSAGGPATTTAPR